MAGAFDRWIGICASFLTCPLPHRVCPNLAAIARTLLLCAALEASAGAALFERCRAHQVCRGGAARQGEARIVGRWEKRDNRKRDYTHPIYVFGRPLYGKLVAGSCNCGLQTPIIFNRVPASEQQEVRRNHEETDAHHCHLGHLASWLQQLDHGSREHGRRDQPLC